MFNIAWKIRVSSSCSLLSSPLNLCPRYCLKFGDRRNWSRWTERSSLIQQQPTNSRITVEVIMFIHDSCMTVLGTGSLVRCSPMLDAGLCPPVDHLISSPHSCQRALCFKHTVPTTVLLPLIDVQRPLTTSISVMDPTDILWPSTTCPPRVRLVSCSVSPSMQEKHRNNVTT